MNSVTEQSIHIQLRCSCPSTTCYWLNRVTIRLMSAAVDWLKQERVSSATQDVVREIVGRAATKLAALETQRSQILRRIHALRYLITLIPEPVSSESLSSDCASTI